MDGEGQRCPISCRAGGVTRPVATLAIAPWTSGLEIPAIGLGFITPPYLVNDGARGR